LLDLASTCVLLPGPKGPEPIHRQAGTIPHLPQRLGSHLLVLLRCCALIGLRAVDDNHSQFTRLGAYGFIRSMRAEAWAWIDTDATLLHHRGKSAIAGAAPAVIGDRLINDAANFAWTARLNCGCYVEFWKKAGYMTGPFLPKHLPCIGCLISPNRTGPLAEVPAVSAGSACQFRDHANGHHDLDVLPLIVDLNVYRRRP